MAEADDMLSVARTDDGLTVVGEIDAYSAPALEAALAELTGRVRLDLAGVEFVDSSGLRVLVDAHQRLAGADGALVIVAPSAAVSRLFEISGMQDYLSIER